MKSYIITTFSFIIYPSAANARATLNDFSTGAVSFNSMLAHRSLTIAGVKISPLVSSNGILRRRIISIKKQYFRRVNMCG